MEFPCSLFIGRGVSLATFKMYLFIIILGIYWASFRGRFGLKCYFDLRTLVVTSRNELIVIQLLFCVMSWRPLPLYLSAVILYLNNTRYTSSRLKVYVLGHVWLRRHTALTLLSPIIVHALRHRLLYVGSTAFSWFKTEFKNTSDFISPEVM